MLFKTILTVAMLVSGSGFAMSDFDIKGAVVPLGDILVNHADTPGAANTEKMKFDLIEVSAMSWLIECNYTINGSEKLTAVIFKKNTNSYSDNSKIFIDDEVYDNSGILNKQGKFVWGPIKLDIPKNISLDVMNFDTINDFMLTQCTATWVGN